MSKRMVVSFCREVLGIELSVGEVCQIEQTVTQRGCACGGRSGSLRAEL